ncbi:unnamed protein product [Darwinula stevensoni]|uniref:Cytochrome P450 n=1 Tax=Darwinula stevensoni TaxID=69355 RepID=A0A7R9A8L8_9CRUS|nr:unnamed protein product [Darwinula stevensoni]CAG0896471.1 unnamed protein product [Darwinula stevensoni]
MSVTLIFASIIIVYLLHDFVKKLLVWFKLPPGPWGVPFLGSVPFLLGGPLHKKLDSLRKKYGDIVTVSLMPYTEAFIMEVQRLARLVPLGVGHAATEDVEFGGYRFPKGTVFMANIWSCHSDPNYWPDPEKFDPGRFLNSDGSLKTKVPSFLPFALGKRQCLGESLARMELFLFVTIFMQKLTFLTTTGHPHPKAESVDSFIINSPKPFQFLVEERK